MDEPTLFDTSTYTRSASQLIADYGVDVDYDPYWAQFERRKAVLGDKGNEGVLGDKVLGDKGVDSTSNELLGDNFTGEAESDVQSPSKKRRDRGHGSGSIHWKSIHRNGKDYPQAWYHYEFWFEGRCMVKSCKYIPKRLLKKVQQLDEEKVPVAEILKLLIRQ